MDTFKWALFSYYIFIGTAQVLLMKASGESAKGTGKGMAYNTASAMIFIEGLKIVCCLAVEIVQGDAHRAEKGESRRTTTMAGWAVYAVPGFLYAVENNLKIPATIFLHPHVFALFNNSKVIFAALGMVMLLGRRFNVLQWMSMALLGASLCVAEVQMLLPKPHAPQCSEGNSAGKGRLLDSGGSVEADDSSGRRGGTSSDWLRWLDLGDKSAAVLALPLATSLPHAAPAIDAWLSHIGPPAALPGPPGSLALREPSRSLAGEAGPEAQSSALFLVGIGLALAASMISGLAGVFNELLLKKRDVDVGLWRKNIWTYQWGVIFNGMGLVLSSRKDASGLALLRGFDGWVWAMILVTALLGISVSMIMKYFDNVVKCFGGSLILYSTTVASMLLFGSKVDAGFILGLLVYSISSYFYAGDHIKKLDVYDKHCAEIEAMLEAKAKASKEMASLAASQSPGASPDVCGASEGNVIGRRADV